MASEIRVDKINSLSGVGTVTLSPTGVDIAGITLSPDGDVFFTGIATGNGSGLTALNASNLASGTVPTARLGSGTASSSTFLAGDSTFKTVTGTTINSNADNRLITGSGTANTLNGESDLTFNGSKLSLSLAGGSNHIVELVNTSANSNEGTVLKLRASGRGGAEDNADVFLTTNNTDTRVFSVTNAGTVNTTGNIVMASGKGIDFSATGDGTGASSVSEVLDDYEEGTWSPVWANASSGGDTVTSNNYHGRYTKVGRVVHLHFYTWSLQTGVSGDIYLQGLPFAAISSFSFIGSVGGRYYNEGEDNQYNLHVRVNGNNSYGNLEFAEAHTGNAVAATFSGFINGYTNFTGTVTYLTNS